MSSQSQTETVAPVTKVFLSNANIGVQGQALLAAETWSSDQSSGVTNTVLFSDNGSNFCPVTVASHWNIVQTWKSFPGINLK